MKFLIWSQRLQPHRLLFPFLQSFFLQFYLQMPRSSCSTSSSEIPMAKSSVLGAACMEGDCFSCVMDVQVKNILFSAFPRLFLG
jgi:hypothetical protein